MDFRIDFCVSTIPVATSAVDSLIWFRDQGESVNVLELTIEFDCFVCLPKNFSLSRGLAGFGYHSFATKWFPCSDKLEAWAKQDMEDSKGDFFQISVYGIITYNSHLHIIFEHWKEGAGVRNVIYDYPGVPVISRKNSLWAFNMSPIQMLGKVGEAKHITDENKRALIENVM